MSVMSIMIDEKKRKALKVIASIEGKTIGGIVSDLIENYIIENKGKIRGIKGKENLVGMMKMSEASFMEWDNEEDEIYDKY